MVVCGRFEQAGLDRGESDCSMNHRRSAEVGVLGLPVGGEAVVL